MSSRHVSARSTSRPLVAPLYPSYQNQQPVDAAYRVHEVDNNNCYYPHYYSPNLVHTDVPHSKE